MPEWIIKLGLWVVGGMATLIMVIGGAFIRSDRKRLERLEYDMQTKASDADHKELQRKLSAEIKDVHEKIEDQGREIREHMAEQSKTMNDGFNRLQDTIIKYMGNGRG